MATKIAITTSSFAQEDATPLKVLKKNNFQWVLNSSARVLEPQETISLLSGCHGVIAGNEIYNAPVLQQLPQLRVISRCGTGLDSVDLNAACDYNIHVYKTPDSLTDAVAELTVGLILNLLRKISLMDRCMHQGKWEKKMGCLVKGKEVGLIGFGRIGQAVGKVCQSFGAKVVYYDPQVKKSPIQGINCCDFNKILRTADIISLHASLSKGSRYLIGANEIKTMKEGVFLINCSRGGLVHEEGLYEALKSGKMAGAALDVFEKEPYAGRLKELDNVILTPHIGAYAREARMRTEMEAVENLMKGLKHLKKKDKALCK